MGNIRDKLQKYLKKILSKIENAPQNQMKSDLRGRLSKKPFVCGIHYDQMVSTQQKKYLADILWKTPIELSIRPKPNKSDKI
jgi:hypothetical protein